MDTAIIIPVFNRRETTSRCLRALESDGVLGWASLYVVDDGCTDGTTEMLRQDFPQAHVIKGNGHLWWTGATALGMRKAFADEAQYFLWLNDDTIPAPKSCARLRAEAEVHNAVVTGQCYPNGSEVIVYGGLVRRGMQLMLAEARGEELLRVDACSGNFVCFPRAIVAHIGFPDGKALPHAFGDLDYTLRSGRAGYPTLADPGARATATPNDWKNHASWLLGDITVPQIWRGLWQKRSYAYAPAHVRFLARHFGFVGALYWAWTIFKRVPISILRLTIPQRWLRKLWGRRSATWREEQRLSSSDNGKS